MDLKKYIRDVPNFPKPGIVFKDITPLLASPEAFGEAVEALAERFRPSSPQIVVGAEARGFLLGPCVAQKLGVGFAPVRKPGKLPYKTISKSYQLEYGTDTIQMHRDAIRPGMRVLLIDDLLATGGTMAAAAELVEELKGEVVGCGFIIELGFLKGRRKLSGYDTFALINYDKE